MSSPVQTEPEEQGARQRPGYQPWGWGLIRGMARTVDEAKAQRAGTPDPPAFSEPLPSKVKTSALTEAQLVRQGLHLDEYLRAWREAEPTDAPRTKKARDSYAKRVYTLMHRYQDIVEEFDERRAQRRKIAEGRPAGPGEVLFGELAGGDRILVKLHGVGEVVSCTVIRRSPEGYGVVGLDTTSGHLYENRYEPVPRADATQINDHRDDNNWSSYWEEEYGLLIGWLKRHSQDADGRDGVHARATRLREMITSHPTFSGTLAPLPAASPETKPPAQASLFDELDLSTPAVEHNPVSTEQPGPQETDTGPPAPASPAQTQDAGRTTRTGKPITASMLPEVDAFDKDIAETGPDTSVADFPGRLLPGESIAPYTGREARESNDFVLTNAQGISYRLTAISYQPGEWNVGREWEGEPDAIKHQWVGDKVDLGKALTWIRRDGESRALAVGRWKRHRHRLEEPVPFSTVLEEEDLEPGVKLVRRFGRSGLLTEYRWGWEHGLSGWLPESPNRKAYDHRFYAAMWRATHLGFDDVPTERLRILAVDQDHEEVCAVSTPFVGKCKKDELHRFVVDVLDENDVSLGHVVICGKHLMDRLTQDHYHGRDVSHVTYLLSERKGSWVDWQDRAHALTGELLTSALAAGEVAPKPDVRGALYREALAIGDQRAARAARKAARDAGLRGKQVAAAGDAVLAARQGRHPELITAAVDRERAWSEHCSNELDGQENEWSEPEPVIDPAHFAQFMSEPSGGPLTEPQPALLELEATPNTQSRQPNEAEAAPQQEEHGAEEPIPALIRNVGVGVGVGVRPDDVSPGGGAAVNETEQDPPASESEADQARDQGAVEAPDAGPGVVPAVETVQDAPSAAPEAKVRERRLAKGWWEHSYQGRTYTSVKLPDELAKGRLATLNYIVVDENREMVARSFGAPITQVVIWAHAHPGVPRPETAGWLQLGGGDPAWPAYSDEERAYVMTGPPVKQTSLDLGAGVERQAPRPVRLPAPAASTEEEPSQMPAREAPIAGSERPTSPQPSPAAPDSGATSDLRADQESGTVAADTGTAPSEDTTPSHKGDSLPAPPEITDQGSGIPPTPAQGPEAGRHRRAQEIAETAAAATTAEQVRELWESARNESLPPDTPVNTAGGTQPLASYLTARGQELVARSAASGAAPAAERGAPARPAAPRTSAAGTSERPKPHRTDPAPEQLVQETGLHQLATSALSSEQGPTVPTVLTELDGVTIYHMVSAEPPPQEADAEAGSRWLYLGLTDDTSNPAIPIAVISNSGLSRITPKEFADAVLAWTQAADPANPIVVNLFKTTPLVRGRHEHDTKPAPAGPKQVAATRAAQDEAEALVDTANTTPGTEVVLPPVGTNDPAAEAPAPSPPEPATTRPETAASHADTPKTNPESSDSAQAATQPHVAPAQEPLTTARAALQEMPATSPGADADTNPETQAPQAQTSPLLNTADDSEQRSELHLSALRELFEALAASAREATTTTVNAPPGGVLTAAEATSARPAVPADLTDARATLDPHLDAINDSPHTTQRIRAELGALIRQIDTTLPQLDHHHVADRHTLISRALDLLIRTAEGLRDLSARMRAPAISHRIEQLTEHLRGSRREPADRLFAPRGDRHLQDLASNQRIIEHQLAQSELAVTQRHALQEKWILNRARWHSHYKAHHGEPPEGLVPHDRRRIAGYPITPSLQSRTVHELGTHLRSRATALASVPETAAQAELFVIMAAAYEELSPPMSSTSASPQPGPSTSHSHQVADRPDVRAAARRLADEASERAARTAGATPSPRVALSAITTHSEQQRTVQLTSAPAGHGPAGMTP